MLCFYFAVAFSVLPRAELIGDLSFLTFELILSGICGTCMILKQLGKLGRDIRSRASIVHFLFPTVWLALFALFRKIFVAATVRG